jgi:hypothetical protein
LMDFTSASKWLHFIHPIMSANYMQATRDFHGYLTSPERVCPQVGICQDL